MSHWCAAKQKAKGAGNPGKPGKKLRLEDLQSQFGVGLKEAANRLGICPTTLKVKLDLLELKSDPLTYVCSEQASSLLPTVRILLTHTTSHTLFAGHGIQTAVLEVS